MVDFITSHISVLLVVVIGNEWVAIMAAMTQPPLAMTTDLLNKSE